MFEVLKPLLYIFLLGLAFVCGIALAKVQTLRQLSRIMSYSSFRTPCELTEELVRIYRPIMKPDPATVRQALEFGESRKLFIGRDSARCDCAREYCLSINIRRRRRMRQRAQEWWDKGLSPI